ncbi:NAD(P)/FAD-dependent oxidoreductase [Lactococcus sp.]|uniref:NAD(P)/FAD-dependent oxidoreductase n=1 Tax=Lactococcus sp. TaxID=44273 RepID=UPI0035AE97FF
MKKIAIIGGGIIGMTLANYIDPEQFEITLIDAGHNQATKASAGIISPWLSKRRNKKWYLLAKNGAAFLEQLVADFELDESIYEKCGSLFVRDKAALKALEELAIERKKEAPEIGDIRLLSPEETSTMLPLLKPAESLYISGGARLDGKAYLEALKKRAQARGVRFITAQAKVEKKENSWLVSTDTEGFLFDQLVLTVGPALNKMLQPLGYTAAVTAQKGQLLSFDTSFTTGQWPVAFLEGEADLIPFQNGKILLGATHENEAGWDLAPTQTAYDQLTQGVHRFLKDDHMLDFPFHYRVGTRAYTKDFAPFFGPIETEKNLMLASGLGSSGLTTGPYIAYLMANYINQSEKEWETSDFQKEMTLYVWPTKK